MDAIYVYESRALVVKGLPYGSLPNLLDYYLHLNQDNATTIIEFFAHLFISEDPNRHQNLISSSMHHIRSLHKVSLQSVHHFSSNVAHKKLKDGQADKPTHDHMLHRTGLLIVAQVLLPRTCASINNPVL